MNSVMEIGEKIIFLENGEKKWEGTNKEIFKTENESISNFVYSSELFKKVRKIYVKENKSQLIVYRISCILHSML